MRNKIMRDIIFSFNKIMLDLYSYVSEKLMRSEEKRSKNVAQNHPRAYGRKK